MTAQARDAGVTVRPMRREDLDAADRVVRLAFGTEFRLPDPMQFLGDGDLIRQRFRANQAGCLVAEAGGEVIGSVTVLNWGSVAVLGPLSVHPDYWNHGIARLLLGPALQAAEAGGARLVQLFTHPNSPRHLRLYEGGGFASQNLIAIMSKPVAPQPLAQPLRLFSTLGPAEQREAMHACQQMTEAVFGGLDLSREIGAVRDHDLGDTVLVQRGGALAGFAVCHTGVGSDAGSLALGIKFGLAARGGFTDLLQAAEALAGLRSAPRIQASVNHARRRAYAAMKDAGYRCILSGVAMRRPAAAGYDTFDIPLLEEWR